jgi:hypothetical protein
VQPVLERYTDTEVGGQRQRSDQFGGAEALQATLCSFWHVATILRLGDRPVLAQATRPQLRASPQTARQAALGFLQRSLRLRVEGSESDRGV